LLKSGIPVIEATLAGTSELFVATVLWEECPSRQRTTCLDAPNECCSLNWGTWLENRLGTGDSGTAFIARCQVPDLRTRKLEIHIDARCVYQALAPKSEETSQWEIDMILPIDVRGHEIDAAQSSVSRSFLPSRLLGDR
jgi:hypothetical protein